MKRKIAATLLALLLLASIGWSYQTAFIIQEQDGVPTYRVPRGLRFPNGSLTGDVNGVVTVAYPVGGITGTLPVANGGTNASSAGITAFNNITGYTVAGATGTTSTNLVFSTSPTLVTPVLGAATGTSLALGGATLGSNALAVTGHLLLEGVTSAGATGTNNLVFSTSPTLVTPTLGAASSTSINNSGGITTATLNYFTDAGSTDDYVATLSPAATAYTTGMMVTFKANTANTGACTVNVNGLGAKALKRGVSTDPADNFIKAGSIVVAVYDGTNFQMIQPAAQ